MILQFKDNDHRIKLNINDIMNTQLRVDIEKLNDQKLKEIETDLLSIFPKDSIVIQHTFISVADQTRYLDNTLFSFMKVSSDSYIIDFEIYELHKRGIEVYMMYNNKKYNLYELHNILNMTKDTIEINIITLHNIKGHRIIRIERGNIRWKSK